MFTVIDNNVSIRGIASIPATGMVDVEVGQQALLQLHNYPSGEFGQVLGTVEKVAPIPHEGSYKVEIAFPDGLRTTHHKELEFKPEMGGSVRIVIRDQRLAMRLFSQLRQIIG